MSHVNENAVADETVRWQAIRNRLHAIAGAVLVLLILLNVIDQATSERWVEIVTQVLNIAGLIVPLVAAELARRNSNPATVAVLPTPAAEVEAVFTTDGSTVAGPASNLKTGTVLDAGVDGDQPV